MELSRSQELLKEINKYRKLYKELPKQAKQFCEDRFEAAMAIDWIYHLNIGELVGTQSQERTKQVLEHLPQKWQSSATCTSPALASSNWEEKETMNTYLAMKELHEIRQEMEETGLLTVEVIRDVHRILLNGLHENAGNLRTNLVYTTYRDKIHFYPPPDQAEQRLYTLIDRHNMDVEWSPPDRMSEEYLSHVFKYAARLLFEFVDAHPFSDGNGRMCRLLAYHAISHITPFPVGLYHTKPETSGRTDYIDAIVKCREYPEEGPIELAAMLIEGAFKGWEHLFYILETHRHSKDQARETVKL